MQEPLYTVTQLAEVFDVSRTAIHKWIDLGRFPDSFEVGEGGGKMVLIPASNVEAVRKEEADKLLKKLDRLGFQAVPA